MNRERVLVVLCAACCCFALVTLSTSLDTTVSGSPQEEFDVSADDLPVSVGDTGELKEAYESSGGEGGESAQGDQTGNGAPAAAENGNSESAQRDGDPKSDDSIRTRTASGQATAQASGASDGESSQSGQQTGLTTENQGRGWLETVRELLPTALGLVVCVLFVAGWLALRYRERLRDRLLGERSGGERFGPESSTVDRPFEPPANEVERVWVEMAERAAVDLDPGMTPNECADRLEADGFDRDAVEELTELFQSVRYGSAVTTTERVERARDCLHRSAPSTDGGREQ